LKEVSTARKGKDPKEYAMKKFTSPIEIPQLPFSIIEAKIRGRIREIIEACLGEEVDAALGAGSYERIAGRRGYRHGFGRRQATRSSRGSCWGAMNDGRRTWMRRS